VPVEEVSREVSEEERVAVNLSRDKVVARQISIRTRCQTLTYSAPFTITTFVLPRGEQYYEDH
jgi:hypothetical protein